MRAMADPGYVYQPWSEERRQRARKAYNDKHGIPEGCRRLYGVNVPDELHDRIAGLAHAVRKRCDDPKAIEEFVRLLVRSPELLKRRARDRLLLSLSILKLMEVNTRKPG
jgi:hypothetical protein